MNNLNLIDLYLMKNRIIKEGFQEDALFEEVCEAIDLKEKMILGYKLIKENESEKEQEDRFNKFQEGHKKSVEKELKKSDTTEKGKFSLKKYKNFRK